MSPASRLGRPAAPDLTVVLDGEPVAAHRGETLAAALIAHGVTSFGRTRTGRPRSPMCNMGTCFDCAVEVDGTPLVRSCLTPVEEGMVVRTWNRT